MPPAKTARIRELNDALRTAPDAIGALILNGSLVITSGVQGRGGAFVTRCLSAVRTFRDFGPDNDPWGEHDMAFMEVDGVRIFYKIDYYDRDLRYHSPDPSDAGVKRRVLTIALADEY